MSNKTQVLILVNVTEVFHLCQILPALSFTFLLCHLHVSLSDTSVFLNLCLNHHVVLQNALRDVFYQLAPIFCSVFVLRNISAVDASIAKIVQDHVHICGLFYDDISSLFDDFFQPYLHLFDSFGVYAVFAVHIA